MINLKRVLVTLPLVILLCLAIWAVYVYKKPHTSASNKPTDIQTDAASLFNDFATNETAANAKYLDKIIEVTGTVDAIQHANGALVLMLHASQLTGEISCRMFDTADSSSKKGEKITLKGKCAGFLSDVNLVDCARVKN